MKNQDPLRYADKDKTGKVTGFVHEVYKRPPPKTDCAHEDFDSEVTINRLADQTPMVFMADVKIRCRTCGSPFRFKGLPGGMNFERPMCSPEAHEARLPIEPSSEL